MRVYLRENGAQLQMELALVPQLVQLRSQNPFLGNPHVFIHKFCRRCLGRGELPFRLLLVSKSTTSLSAVAVSARHIVSIKQIPFSLFALNGIRVIIVKQYCVFLSLQVNDVLLQGFSRCLQMVNALFQHSQSLIAASQVVVQGGLVIGI